MEPIVETSFGAVRGEAADGVEVYRGIPYAAPPTGQRRFRAPEPPEPWDAPLDGRRFGACAVQSSSGRQRAVSIRHTLPRQDEDCLTLNVWTPGADGRRRPVMVWIHGGSFMTGSGAAPVCDGSALARRGDVVVVTLNYRVGIFGFLHLDSLVDGAGISGNQGLLDQVAALRWVRNEIGAFGGDPTNVTVFGESAGAMSIAGLLVMPEARGLFQKAILQSGAANMFMSRDEASAVARRFLAALGLEPEDAGRLRTLPASELLAAQERVAPLNGRTPFGPVLDGDVLPLDPLAAIAEGAAGNVALLIGTNEDEMAYFYAQEPAVLSMTDDVLRAMVADGLGDGFGPLAAGAIVDAYRAAREEAGGDASPGALWIAITTDYLFRIPTIRLAEAQARHTPVYAYLFDWKSPAAGGRLGAGHAIDVPFVFGTFRHADVAALELDQESADDLSAAIQDAWTRFSRFGSPATPLLPEWLPYEPGMRWTMRLGPACAMVNGPAEAERLAWDNLAGAPRIATA